MRFLFTSIRGQGHTRPLLPFAKALQALGHEAAIASPEDTRAITDKAGIELFAVDRMTDADIKAHWKARGPVEGEEMVRVAIAEMFAGKTARAAMPKLEAHIRDWKPDMILRDSAEFGAFPLAEKYGVPHARIAVHNNEMEAVILRHAEEAVDLLLADHDLPAQNGAGLWAEPAFTAFPAGFDGDAKHGPDNPPFRVNLSSRGTAAPSDWTPKTDRPLVYMTFGTVAGGELFPFREVYAMAVVAAGGLDAEVLLTTGPNIDPEVLGPVPANVDIQSFVPQDAVLRHSRVVMHHGGSGTLLGALEAGVPMVVVPLFADQPNNAARAEAAGLGLAVTDRSAENMRNAVERVIADNGMKRRAREVASEMAEMPGIEAAVERILAMAGH